MQEQIESFEQVSMLEQERMRNLDLMIGTETHFHPTEKYEDRIDSQTVFLNMFNSRWWKSNFSNALRWKVSAIKNYVFISNSETI